MSSVFSLARNVSYKCKLFLRLMLVGFAKKLSADEPRGLDRTRRRSATKFSIHFRHVKRYTSRDGYAWQRCAIFTIVVNAIRFTGSGLSFARSPAVGGVAPETGALALGDSRDADGRHASSFRLRGVLQRPAASGSSNKRVKVSTKKMLSGELAAENRPADL